MRKFTVLLRSLCLACAVLVAAPSAAAPSKKAKAKKQFNTAEKQYKLGEFEEASRHYAAAYALTPFPALLFNLGQCHRKMGDCERAIFYYQGFLRDKPDATNAVTVQQLIDECRADLDAKVAAQKPLTPPPESEVVAVKVGSPLAFTPAIDPESAPATSQNPLLESRATVSSDKSLLQTWWFWTAVGCVAAAGGVTTYLLLNADTQVVAPRGSMGTIDARQK